jgi:antimicrobial peptide system SdpA family protein
MTRNRFLVLTFTTVTTTLFWGVVALYSFRTSLPYTPARLPIESQRNNALFRAFFPEGFSFFTRNPREPVVEIYKYENSTYTLTTIPNGSIKNMLGINKSSRAQNLESGFILSKLRPDDWIKCPSNLDSCLTSEPLPVIHLKNNYNTSFLCGELVVVVRKPVPWAWSKVVSGDRMEKEFAKLFVECIE